MVEIQLQIAKVVGCCWRVVVLVSWNFFSCKVVSKNSISLKAMSVLFSDSLTFFNFSCLEDVNAYLAVSLKDLKRLLKFLFFSNNIKFKTFKDILRCLIYVNYRVFFLFWLIRHVHNSVIFWAKIEFLDVFYIYVPIIFCKKNFRAVVGLLIFLCCF